MLAKLDYDLSKIGNLSTEMKELIALHGRLTDTLNKVLREQMD